MGSLIAQLIKQAEDMVVIAAAEHAAHPLYGQKIDQGAGPQVVTVDELDLSEVDVLVDFTLPVTSLKALRLAERGGCAFVSGTTGLTAEQRDIVRGAASNIALVHSPNMAPGVNFFFHAVQGLSRQLGPEYGVEVVEIHHRHKVDAPSGTAKRLVELIGRDVPCHSLRLGEVVGEHQVHFAAHGERITLTHQAESREAFAQGALCAIRFIAGKKTGFFDMSQVLALPS